MPSLSDIIAMHMQGPHAERIISTAIESGLTGKELQVSLVMSGAAMGVDQLQTHVLGLLHSQVELLRKAVKATDDALASAQGDDEMMAFVQSIRAPLVERVQEHISIAEASMAQRAEQELGINQAMFTSQVPLDEMDQEDLAAAGAAVAFANSAAFYGFIKVDDIPKMKCSCIGCLTEQAGNAVGEDMLAKARKRFGSVDKAMLEFGKHVIERERKKMRDFEAKFELASVDEDEANATTSALLSQFLGGATGEDNTH